LIACTAGDEAPHTDPAATPNAVTLSVTDYALEAPDTIPAGFTTFRMVNNSEQFHMGAADQAPGRQDTGRFPPGVQRSVPHGRSGDYVFFCLVTAPDGRPHTAHGMIQHIRIG
jgi:hypothetical protein